MESLDITTGRIVMSGTYNNLFRINLAEYYLVNEDGLYKRILPRPKILFDTSTLIIVSKLDQKVYNFTGSKASERQQSESSKLANNFGVKYGFTVERIIYPTETIPPEHLQFIEYFTDDYYHSKESNFSKYYHCYFCEQLLVRKGNACSSCGKEIILCFVCDFPILFGDLVGKCSLCGATAHLVHFYEWIKSLGICPKCNEKLYPEGIIPITEENKDTFFQ
ncbi:MAG TPA: hypothetical protein VMZ29_15665 [Candidatus Bathyarchaeia archaeon]|nr:hypothetical protein [Candidatus Bathyarchaeia archaeon]